MPVFLDFRSRLDHFRANFERVTTIETADRDPKRSKEIPEVNTRQRDAPSGAAML